MRKNIIAKIKKAGLVGRGGAGFPVWLKWQMVHKARGPKKYVVCNIAEGEPAVNKDKYILKHYPERVIDGVKIALYFLRARQAFIYLNPDYEKELAPVLKKIIGQAPIEIFVKPPSAGYIGGEETSALNAIEGRRIEPRLRPPFPTIQGLWGCPTLVNNAETFYNVSLVYAKAYKKTRFYSISGDCLWAGVYEYSQDHTIKQILKASNNYPNFPFFVQVGGGAAGLVLNFHQLDQPVSGAGSIVIYSLAKHSPRQLLKNWSKFFKQQSCGQCVPCREGTYRLWQILKKKTIDWELLAEILLNLKEASFCALGASVPVPLASFIKNVLPYYQKLPNNDLGRNIFIPPQILNLINKSLA